MTLEVGMGNSECGNGAQGSKLKATETEARGQKTEFGRLRKMREEG